MNTLNNANEYVRAHAVSEREKPHYHVTPEIGWMNDPNGFSVFRGEVHLFYQFHPYSDAWGPMHWGHVKSRDMIKWERLPVAMAPDSAFDEAGCFSGTAISVADNDTVRNIVGDKDSIDPDSNAHEPRERHVLMYTSVTGSFEDYDTIYQNQSIAIGDGVTYEKYAGNPVISGDMLPDGFNKRDFRDPKLWQSADGTYYAIAANMDAAGRGQLPLFASADLKTWEYRGLLAHNDGRFGGMWECPDFFELDGQQMLVLSPIDMEARGYEFHPGKNAIYFTGEWAAAGDANDDVFSPGVIMGPCEENDAAAPAGFCDAAGNAGGEKTKMKYACGDARSLDYGPDYYAPQTTLLDDGRRVLIAWMHSWDNEIKPEAQKWNGMMTIPRELKLVKISEDEKSADGKPTDVTPKEKKPDGKPAEVKLLQQPIREIENYYRNHVELAELEIADGIGQQVLRGRCMDMTVELPGNARLSGDYSKFRISFGCDGTHHTDFTLDRATGIVEFDRSFSGVTRDVVHTRRMKIDSSRETIRLRFLLDSYSVELFANDGEQCFSATFYTPLEADGVVMSCDGRATVRVTKDDIVVE